MALRLEYVGSGRMRDAATRNLVSAKKVVEEFNAMAERLEAAEPDRASADNGNPREINHPA